MQQSQMRTETCGLLGTSWISVIRAIRTLGFYFSLVLRLGLTEDISENVIVKSLCRE